MLYQQIMSYACEHVKGSLKDPNEGKQKLQEKWSIFYLLVSLLSKGDVKDQKNRSGL